MSETSTIQVQMTNIENMSRLMHELSRDHGSAGTIVP